MRLDLLPVAGSKGDRKEFHEAAAEARFDRTVDDPPPERAVALPRRSLLERMRRPLMLVLPVVVALLGAAVYLVQEPYVSTDNAFVRAAKVTVNARVSGQAVEIAVHDNEGVRQGQVLFRIDPEPYQIAVDQAEARLGSARLQIEGLKATYRQQQAELQSARDSADFDEREYDRKKMLVASDFTPRAVFERAETNLKVSRQRISSIEQQIASTVVALDGDPDIDVNRHPTVRAAKAQLDRARLDLSYATVTAPDDGVVTRVDDLQIGGFVNAGTPVFSLLSSRHVWIEANFRETGLTHMRPGQEATIDVDAYPDRKFRAHIVSMSPGTGSDFSVLPPENATGNWVKVVQRLPVRLELDDVDASRPLFSGISVTARVDTGYRGSLRHLLQPTYAAGLR
ncbi:membrane fusion protein, multidrug efflux system [Bradyrhizobium sp. Ghvi]|uniref:HlyD family secretion protein n=1 Tax=Bradyrhizobium sp. Ghvi TaxID=1855319 RepID=UPI0008E1FEC5|nr:HlyD family secretion protein [Bradyrhizobium sp. Ghvi]SFO95631.1 membrane fusion protein, multidrug efflux system [Bradyrhizobium sp. Ghvi]